MPRILLFLLAASLIPCLSSCGESAEEATPPVNEYLVVGNDKGYRNAFIDQGNHVLVTDSALHVTSLRSVEVTRTYPIVDSFVIGGSDPVNHWRLGYVGNDTITVRDTAQGNSYYLRRMRRVPLHDSLASFITDREMIVPSFFVQDTAPNYTLFAGLAEGVGFAHSIMYQPYIDYSKQVGLTTGDDRPVASVYYRSISPVSNYRIFRRFAQPVLATEGYNGGLRIRLIDSLSMNGDTLYGMSTVESSPTSSRPFRLVHSPPAKLLDEVELDMLMMSTPVTRLLLDGEDAKVHRRASAYDAVENPTRITSEEAGQLRIEKGRGQPVRIFAGERLVQELMISPHPTMPYLRGAMANSPFEYWRYHIHDDSVTIYIPLQVEYGFTEPRNVFSSSGGTVTVPGKALIRDDEWRITYPIPGNPR